MAGRAKIRVNLTSGGVGLLVAGTSSQALAADGIIAAPLWTAGIAVLAVCASIGCIWLGRRLFRERQAGEAEQARLEAEVGALKSSLKESEDALREMRLAAEAKERDSKRLDGDLDRLHQLLDGAPFAAWRRSPTLDLVWANRTYREMVGVGTDPNLSSGPIPEISSSLDPDQPRRLAARAAETGELQEELRHFVVAGDRRALRVVETPLVPGGNLAGYAYDVTDLEEARAELARHIEAHAEVLENMATAIAIYGPDKRLMFFNRAYANLWRLDEEMLSQAPDINEILDAQRENRRLPEQADYRAYKASRNALFTNVIEPQEELVQLPDETMLRIVITPHPFGGLLFMFEDVTDKIVLERARNTLIAVQRATLDNLYEGIAVFGADGRLKLFNSGYARIWGLDEDKLSGEPHVSELIDRLLERGEYSDAWGGLRDRLIAEATSRTARTDRMERPDGTVLDYAVVPLPDGQTLFTYLDVTDSQRIERALIERNEALQAADQLKTEFVANVSYELRTPLNTIIGFTEILKNRYFGDLNERQSEYIDGVLDSSQQLLLLINDILDLASIEAGHMTLNVEGFDVHQALTAVVTLVGGLAVKRNLKVVLDCPQDIGVLEADERRMKQVLFNLMSNAIKFTPAGGRVTLGAARADGEVKFWVSDTGVGIPEEQQARVFERFYKLQHEGARRGVGLGLSLVRSFIELHGGRVELRSIPGSGTQVACFLPAATGDRQVRAVGAD